MFGNDSTLFTFRGPFGVPVQVSSSIIMLPLIFVGLSGGGPAMMFNLGFVALLIVSIFLHELGHAWGCIVQGVPVRRIVLHGGGGFCEHARSPSFREQELIVAMGPIVNLAIWALAGLATPYASHPILIWALIVLSQMNLFLAVFNMMPVQPLDGGKLLQLGLLRFLPAATATRIAGGIGLVISVLWIPAMIWSYLFIGFVLFFIPSIRLHWQMTKV